jgi:hypothetical protein
VAVFEAVGHGFSDIEDPHGLVGHEMFFRPRPQSLTGHIDYAQGKKGILGGVGFIVDSQPDFKGGLGG